MRETRSMRRKGRRNGQALMEFALIAPILMLIVLGIVEFGRAWNAYQTLTDAAREACRTAVVANGVPIDSIYAIVDHALARVGMDPDAETTTVTNYKTETGQPTVVAISYPYQLGWIQPLLNWSTGQASITLKTQIAMRQE